MILIKGTWNTINEILNTTKRKKHPLHVEGTVVAVIQYMQ